MPDGHDVAHHNQVLVSTLAGQVGYTILNPRCHNVIRITSVHPHSGDRIERACLSPRCCSIGWMRGGPHRGEIRACLMAHGGGRTAHHWTRKVVALAAPVIQTAGAGQGAHRHRGRRNRERAWTWLGPWHVREMREAEEEDEGDERPDVYN